MPKSTVTWVLVADGCRARLLARDAAGTGLEPALDQEFIGTNLASGDIASDRPGRSFDSGGEGRHAMEPPTDPKRHAKQAFAHDVAGILETARKRNEFERLVVVAPPQALARVCGGEKTASKSFAGSARYKVRLIGVCLRDGGGFCRSEDGEDCVRL